MKKQFLFPLVQKLMAYIMAAMFALTTPVPALAQPTAVEVVTTQKYVITEGVPGSRLADHLCPVLQPPPKDGKLADHLCKKEEPPPEWRYWEVIWVTLRTVFLP